MCAWDYFHKWRRKASLFSKIPDNMGTWPERTEQSNEADETKKSIVKSKAHKLVIAGWLLAEQRQMCCRGDYKIRSSGQNSTAHASQPDNHTQRRGRDAADVTTDHLGKK